MKYDTSIRLWTGDGKEMLLAAGYKDGHEMKELTSEEIGDVVMRIFEQKLNVMVSRFDEGRVIIWVDTKRFSQR